MRRAIPILPLLILAAFSTRARAFESAPGYVMRYAGISNDQIEFSYEDDQLSRDFADGASRNDGLLAESSNARSRCDQ